MRSEEHTSELQSRVDTTDIYTLSLHDALPIYVKNVDSANTSRVLLNLFWAEAQA